MGISARHQDEAPDRAGRIRIQPPPVFSVFEGPVDNLPVGSTSKAGVLGVGQADTEGVTGIRCRYSSGPPCLLHPLHPDPHRPGLAFPHTVPPGGGPLQGGRYRPAARRGPGTSTHLASQAATKSYRMDHNHAARTVDLTADADAFCEHPPDPLVPFRGSRPHQRIRVTTDPSATVIPCETVLPGRVARGGEPACTLLHTDLEAGRPDGRLLFADRTHLAPPEADLRTVSGRWDSPIPATPETTVVLEGSTHMLCPGRVLRARTAGEHWAHHWAPACRD